jgi:hypothetical protein
MLELLASDQNHKWTVTSRSANNLCMTCTVCQVWVQQVHPIATLNKLLHSPCLSADAVWTDQWDTPLHDSHKVVRTVKGWTCQACDVHQKLCLSTLNPKLGRPCRPRRPRVSKEPAPRSIAAYFTKKTL